MADTKMKLVDWLDDLCVRFIINLPREELESVERICFQVEEAQWFYEDFIRPLDPTLPSLSLRNFSLRIFQHCPMLSEWSPYHHSAAFSEFLAYKTRVPVRGAIMLNEAMDQVVLVKGWKKGANWSFPRGKINKDEKDIDCAVREVYEETGFDIRAAGLVGEEKDAKFIEVTMREQHMRLYVFRGVPMDTHFEPKTRKEISKIEWYRLCELPTLKKQKHQEGIGHELAMNANKFYMVAPFLVPLKKWIAQQKKLDFLKDSYEDRLAPTTVFEDPVTEEEPEIELHSSLEQNSSALQHAPSDLPEVSVSRSGDTEQGATLHLKRMLNISNSTSSPQAHDPSPDMDQSRSNALLAFLKNGNGGQALGGGSRIPPPETPLEQLSAMPKIPQTPHHHQPQSHPFSQLGPAPVFPFPPASGTDYASHQNQQPYPWPNHTPGFRAPDRLPFERLQFDQQPNRPGRPGFNAPEQHAYEQQKYKEQARNLRALQKIVLREQEYEEQPSQPGYPHPPHNSMQEARPFQFPAHTPSVPPSFPPSNFPAPPHQVQFDRSTTQARGPAPYQRTGDPEFANMLQFPNIHMPSIPPASRLPPAKLTTQSLSLLNTFKGNKQPMESSNVSPQPDETSKNGIGVSVDTRNKVITSTNTVEVAKLSSSRTGYFQNAQASSDARPDGQNTSSFTYRIPLDAPNMTTPRTEAPAPVKPVSTQTPVAKPRPRSQHQEKLLNLFRKPSMSVEAIQPSTAPQSVPVELSAQTPSLLPVEQSGPVQIAMRPSPKLAKINTLSTSIKPTDGITSATVSGPLNQPQFDLMIKSTSRRPSGTSSTAEPTAKKTQSPVPVTILPRRSTSEATDATIKTSETTLAKQTKPFQPQILRRPAQGTAPANLPHKPKPANLSTNPEPASLPSEPEPASLPPKPEQVAKPALPQQPSFDSRGSQPEPHKQTLLSLFGKPSVPVPSPTSATTSLPVAASPHSAISPLDMDTRIGATQSTRSRLGSLSSMVGSNPPLSPSQPTPAADKKFLLDFLGGVAKSGK